MHRNKGIDAILAAEWHGKPVCIRIQRSNETIEEAATALCRAAERKGGAKLILVVMEHRWGLPGKASVPASVTVVHSTTAAIRNALLEARDLRLVAGR